MPRHIKNTFDEQGLQWTSKPEYHTGLTGRLYDSILLKFDLSVKKKMQTEVRKNRKFKIIKVNGGRILTSMKYPDI